MQISQSGPRRQHDKDEPVTIEQEVLQAPDGGWGWFVVLGSSIVHAIIGGFERSNGVMYLQLLSRYNQSATATAWVLSLFSTLRLAMGPLASALCNKFSCRFVVILGTAISSFGVLVSGFVSDLPYLYLTYGILGGVGRAFVYTPGLIIVGYYFSKKRGIAVGLATSGVAFGSFLLPPLTELLFNEYGFSGTFIVLAAIMSNFFVCGSLFRPLGLHRRLISIERNKSEGSKSITKDGTMEHLLHPIPVRTANITQNFSETKLSSSLEITDEMTKETTETSMTKQIRSRLKMVFSSSDSGAAQTKRKPLLEVSLLKNFAFCALCIQLFLFTLSLNSTFVFLPALAEEHGVTPIEGAYLVSILGILDGIARLVMSSVLDLKSVKPYRLLIYNGVMFLVAVVSLLMPSMKGFWQFVVTSGLYGLLCGTYISQKSVVVVDILGVESLSSSLGLLLLFQGLSGFIGPTVGGIFKDFLGTYDMAFYFGSIGIVAGGLTMAAGNIWLYRQKKQTETHIPGE
ncbi:monocarboxylate transporter 4-like isoform X2 [Mercenaria mercenaria]|uniref:monocarboxylate transporter 4-like isoform X2 n=1 Tax=Mercenaria mercenaria TaxID=6596 RepID=UPI00234F2540|nr:monocarboxylate transporter 4-like isoform X2 [Mercenaria mercenaria]